MYPPRAMSHPSLHFFFHYTLFKLLFCENSLYYMNISDLNHQKDSFYECIKQTYDKRNKSV